MSHSSEANALRFVNFGPVYEDSYEVYGNVVVTPTPDDNSSVDVAVDALEKKSSAKFTVKNVSFAEYAAELARVGDKGVVDVEPIQRRNLALLTPKAG